MFAALVLSASSSKLSRRVDMMSVHTRQNMICSTCPDPPQNFPFHTPITLPPGGLFTKDTSYIVTYLFSRDINIPSCSGIVVACEVRLSRLTEPVPVHCQRGCVGQCSGCHAGDSGFESRARTIFVVCFSCFFLLLARYVPNVG